MRSNPTCIQELALPNISLKTGVVYVSFRSYLPQILLYLECLGIAPVTRRSSDLVVLLGTPN